MTSRKNLFIVMGFFMALSCCLARKVPRSKPARDFDYFLNEGTLLLQRGDYEGAAAQFNTAISLNPKSSRAHNLGGIAYFRQKNYGAAEAQFLRAVALNPSYAEAYNNLGSVYFADHQFPNAERMYQKAIALSPNSASPCYSLGTLLLIQGRSDEGTRYLARGIELDPQFLAAHGSLVVNVPSPGADWGETYFVYARLYSRTGHAEQAFEFLRKAQKAGFRDWKRIMEEKDFESLRQDPRIKEFIRQEEPSSDQERRP